MLQKAELSLRNECFDAWKILAEWITRRQFIGYDPYDIKATKWHHFLSTKIRPTILQRITNYLLGHAEYRFPKGLRYISKVAPALNANTLALVARANLVIARKLKDQECQRKADRCLTQLVDNPSPGLGGNELGWGYPFTWHAGQPNNIVKFPPNNPIVVITAEAGHAFLDSHELTGSSSALENAVRCSRFFTNKLNIDRLDNGICFSYSPIDRFHVHNINLNVAAFLTRLGTLLGDNSMLELSRKARQYSVSLQNGDGSWFYWGPPDYHSPAFYNIDSYHTGMNLQWLKVCLRYDPIDDEERALTKGLKFYTNRLFDSDYSPRFSPIYRYPKDIHAVAQALVTLSLFAEDDPGTQEFLSKVVRWGLDYMRNDDGSFAYRVHRTGVDRTPYMRWGQAWMCWGLGCAACS